MHEKVYESQLLPTYQILWYPDYSCCRDKANWAAGRHVAGVIFSKPSGQLHHDMTTHIYLSGLGPSGQLYRDQTTHCNLPGLTKTPPAQARTATNQTIEPLYVRYSIQYNNIEYI